jgi:hypothetical protein
MKKVFTCYDSKTEAYLPPFIMSTSAEAIRAFETTSNDPNSNMCRYPDDFTLFEIGTWDDDKGTISMHEAKLSLGIAREYHKTPTQPPQLGAVE